MNLETWNARHRPGAVMCGGCKATGLKHVWNSKGDLVPEEPRVACTACNGSGWASHQQRV